MPSDIYGQISFKLGVIIEPLNCIVWCNDSSVDDFDLHSRSQLYENAETCVLFFLQISQSV